MSDGDPIDTYYDAVELHDGREEKFDRQTGKWQCQRAFLMDWDHRMQFVAAVCGYSRLVQGRLFRVNPHQYPGVPGICLAKTTAIKGIGASFDNGYLGQEIAYEKAIVTVGYETPDFQKPDQQTDYFLKESYAGSAQMISTPKGVYKFDDGTILDEHLGKQMGSTALTITISQWMGYDPTFLEPHYGKVNSSKFRGWDAGKALFLTADANPSTTPDGYPCHEVALKVMCRSIEWNKFLHPKDGDWQELDPLPYEETDLNNLIPQTF